MMEEAPPLSPQWLIGKPTSSSTTNAASESLKSASSAVRYYSSVNLEFMLSWSESMSA